MSSHPQDEFSADALSVIKELEAETGTKVRLNINRIVAMVDTVEGLMSDGTVTDHEEIVGIALSGGMFQDDLEYTAYKRWLDKIFKRRKATA